MANPFPITVGALTYEVVEDREAHFDAVVSGAVTDEVTGRAPRTAVAVRPTRDGAVGKYLEHGVWCVACDLERALPGYPVAPETFDVELSAPGYRPASLTVTVAAGSAIPVAAADVALRPLPVRLEGRLTRSTLDPTPVADGIVRIADRPGQALVSLRTALHGAHPQGTNVRPIVVTAAGTERTLAAPAESGARAIALDDVTGLAGPGRRPRLATRARARPRGDRRRRLRDCRTQRSVDPDLRRRRGPEAVHRLGAAGAPADAHARP